MNEVEVAAVNGFETTAAVNEVEAAAVVNEIGLAAAAMKEVEACGGSE